MRRPISLLLILVGATASLMRIYRVGADGDVTLDIRGKRNEEVTTKKFVVHQQQCVGVDGAIGPCPSHDEESLPGKTIGLDNSYGINSGRMGDTDDGDIGSGDMDGQQPGEGNDDNELLSLGGAFSADATVDDIWDTLQCDDLFENPRPIHPEATWTFLRGVYAGVVGPNVRSTMRRFDGNGFQKSVIAKQSEGKGRGVFANEFIRKHELVWTATDHTARFDSGTSYRTFLATIPVDLACDVIQWAYVQDLGSSTTEKKAGHKQHHSHHDLKISVDLNEGSFMNTDDDDPNIGCPDKSWNCEVHYFALRDIHRGEELLCYYGSFAVSDGWEVFGL